MIGLLKKINASIDGWFKTPMDDVLPRIGLFRILYALFFLWYLSDQFAARLGALDSRYFHLKIWLIEAGPDALNLQRALFLEGSLVFLLVLLLLGRWTNWVTAGVAVVGTVLFAYYSKVDPEHGEAFPACFIPLAMWIDGRWGKAWSLDAVIARRSGGSDRTADRGAGHSIGARCVLALLAVFFISAAYYKIVGTWLIHDWVMGKIVAEANVKSALYEFPINPLGPMIVQTPWMYNFLRVFTIVFEAAFILTLFSARIRDVVFATAMLFHTINGVYFVVTFTPVVIAYALFVNWQELIGRYLPAERISERLKTVSPLVLSIGAVAMAAAFAGLWNAGPWLRPMMNLGGTIDQRTIWFPLAPVTLVMCIVVLYRWVRGRPPLTA
jgi:hypothetical protein